MNTILYIGQYTQGSTSRMRADELSKIINASKFDFIDTNIPFYKTSRLTRSIGFRFNIGPLIWQINKFIKNNLSNTYYDLIWIDKGVFLKEKTIEILRQQTDKLIHYTPDMAFYANKSSMFENSLKFYDKVITTKSAEIEKYLELIPKSKLVITNQGFSKDIHKPYHKFNEKDNSVVFIGLAEFYRYKIVELLIKNDIKVKLVGKGWLQFVEKNKNNENLEFIAEGLFDTEYSKLISSSKFALGLLSKNFPELHTTRTFEIPACGSVLITESNEEIISFYNNQEVIFYDSPEEMIFKIKYYQNNSKKLEELTNNGYNKVINSGYDYNSILTQLLKKI